MSIHNIYDPLMLYTVGMLYDVGTWVPYSKKKEAIKKAVNEVIVGTRYIFPKEISTTSYLRRSVA